MPIPKSKDELNRLSAKQQMLQAKYMAVLNIQLLRFYQGLEIVL